MTKPTLYVSDITVRYREVPYLEKCPKCNASFLGDGTDDSSHNLTVWEFQDQSRPHFIKDGEVRELNRCMVEPGEMFIERIAYVCGVCGEVLAEGELNTPIEYLDENDKSHPVTTKQILALADAHIKHFTLLILRHNDGTMKGVRVDECKKYIEVWSAIRNKGGDNLTKEERNEVFDAVSSGDYDKLLRSQD